MDRHMRDGYSTQEVARLVRLTPQQIRAFVRAGVVKGWAGDDREGVGRPFRFAFRDVLILKMAAKLCASGLSAPKVMRAMRVLKQQLCHARPLSSLRLSAVNGRVVASDGEESWEPETGQRRLRLDCQRVEPSSARGIRLAVAETSRAAPAGSETANASALATGLSGGRSADAWFDLGFALEASDLDGAYGAYLRALAVNPEHVEATINLGRLCSMAGEPSRAAAYFRQAVRLAPGSSVAHYNLGVALEDLDDPAGATQAYQAALVANGSFADAHYNLATLLDKQGEEKAAAIHKEAYEALLRGEH